MTTVARLMTFMELSQLPRGRQRHELVRGELRTMPPAGREHGLVETAIAWAIRQFVEPRKLGIVTLGDTGYLIQRTPDTVRAPDVGFISATRARQAAATDHYWPFAPELAVEVLSPSDSADEVDEKVLDWLETGSRVVWVVSPKRRVVTVYQLGRQPVVLRQSDTLDGGDILPGLSLPLATVFADLGTAESSH